MLNRPRIWQSVNSNILRNNLAYQKQYTLHFFSRPKTCSSRMGWSTHATGTQDPPEVRNWKIHLVALVASMSALASESAFVLKFCFD